MKLKNVILITLFAIGIMVVFTSCDEKVANTSDQVVAKQTEQMMNEANRQTGLPAIINWRAKKDLKMIYELEDQENLICHAYFFNEIEGKVGDYIGKCRGFGIPYSAQYSNPEKMVNGGKMLGYSTDTRTTIQLMPQPEPNGLFKPTSSSATWLLLIDEKGNIRPSYFEPTIIVLPFKKW